MLNKITCRNDFRYKNYPYEITEKEKIKTDKKNAPTIIAEAFSLKTIILFTSQKL